jgi:hypothetical protein
MAVDVEHAWDRYRDVGAVEDAITCALHRLSDWFYAQFRRDYEYQSSETAVAEAMEATGYIFKEHGRIAG